MSLFLTINERLDRVEIIIESPNVFLIRDIQSPFEKESGIIAGTVALRIQKLLVVILKGEVTFATTASGSGSGGGGGGGVFEEKAVHWGDAQTGAHAGETGEGAEKD